MNTNVKNILRNPRLYVPEWFQRNKSSPQSAGMLFDTLWLDYREDVLALKAKKFKAINEKNMQKAFNEYLRVLPLKKLSELCEGMVCSGEDLAELQKWAAVVAANPRPTDALVMAHWCWLVKRKAMGLPVIHHIMPVIVGPQGSGKTMAISKLIGPWEQVRLMADVPMLAEQSTYQSMSTHAVIMFDELAGVGRVDMNVLKRQISTETNSFRPLYKQEMVTVPQRCSFIGASNTNLDESIFDSTGMRRFYQIVSPKQLDWDAINAIDYKALWLGIDENKPMGYLVGDDLRDVHNIQQAYAMQDEIELFIQANGVNQTSEAYKEIDARTLYSHYAAWAKEHGTRNPLGYTLFCKKLINRGVAVFEKRSTSTTRIRYFRVGTECTFANGGIQIASGTVLEFAT
jgi:hypothetical protein